MTCDEFVALVAEMRAFQRAWFDPKTRTDAVLDRSKRLERDVDAAIREMRDGQGRLFEGE